MSVKMTVPAPPPSLTRTPEEKYDRARRALANFYRMKPNAEAFARIFTQNPRMRIEPTEGTSRTDGKDTIWLRVNIELGDEVRHNRMECNKRDGLGRLTCEACLVREDVLVSLFHEIAHVAYGSFEEMNEAEKMDAIDRAVREAKSLGVGERRLEKVQKAMRERPPTTFTEAAARISKYLHPLNNALEDARINAMTMRSRPGMVPMFEARTRRVFEQGMAQTDGSIIHWRDQPENAQITVALLVLASGYYESEWFTERVDAAVKDERLSGLVMQAVNTSSAGEIYRLCFPILERLRDLGFCKDPDDEPEPDEEDTGGDSDSKGDPEDHDPSDPSDAPDPGDPSDEDASDEPQEGGADGDPTDDSEADDSDPDDAEGAGDSDDTDEDAGDDGDEADGDGDGDGGDASEDDDEDGGSGSDEDGDAEDGEPDDEGQGSGQGEPDDEEGEQEGEADGEGDCEDAEAGDSEPTPTEDGNEGGSGEGEDEEPQPEPDAEGDPDDMEKALAAICGHAVGTSGTGHQEEQPDDDIATAITQSISFDGPSKSVAGVRVVSPGDTTTAGYTIFRDEDRLPEPWKLLPLPENLMQKNLGKTRVTFSENRKGSKERNLKSGKVNAKSLGRKVPVALHSPNPVDPRIFQKRRQPGRRDYFVVIGIDVSGSTRYDNILGMLKSAAYAQAELLDRVGVDFEIWCHSGSLNGKAGAANGYGEWLEVDMFRIKDVKERWNDEVKRRLRGVTAAQANLDGHTFEFYRKRMDASNATNKILMYYTDGQMPAENRIEELAVLKREIRECRNRGYEVVGVGIRNEDPTEHGLDCVRIDEMEDVPKVVDELHKRLTR